MDIKKLADELHITKSSIDQFSSAIEDLQRKITEAEQVRGKLMEQLRGPEAYEEWLTSEQLEFVKLDVEGAIWWAVKVDSDTVTFVLHEARHPECPCLCCHERMVFSPYNSNPNSEDEDPDYEDRHPAYGFRKEWAEWLIEACKVLKCNRVEVYGLDNAQKAQKVTPLPLEWSYYRDYEGLAKLVLPPWLRLRDG